MAETTGKTHTVQQTILKNVFEKINHFSADTAKNMGFQLKLDAVLIACQGKCFSTKYERAQNMKFIIVFKTIKVTTINGSEYMKY